MIINQSEELVQEMKSLDITDKDFEYLYIQQGSISHIKERKLWEKEYNEKLYYIYDQIKEMLPDKCDNILDIGGGLGGIDIVLNDHYKGCHIEIIDGKNDKPIVIEHDKTFSNHEVTKSFLKRNGVEKYKLSAPGEYKPNKKDLIISYSAYCFHIEPNIYLNDVLNSCHKETVLILTIRKNSGYEDILSKYFYIDQQKSEGNKKVITKCLPI